jgi:hypothetical protein
VRGCSRYHKYTLGTDLRDGVRRALGERGRWSAAAAALAKIMLCHRAAEGGRERLSRGPYTYRISAPVIHKIAAERSIPLAPLEAL